MTPSIRRAFLRALCAIAFLLVLTNSHSLSAQSMPMSVPNRIGIPINDAARVTLHGYVAPQANPVNDRGAAPDSMPFEELHLVLRRSSAQEVALKQLLQSQQKPGSREYHKWLTPAQFGQQFGPSSQDMTTVEAWLSSQGFEVAGPEPGRQVIAFRGNVGQLRSAFGVEIHRYIVDGNTHYAAANNPQIPAALAPVVAGFASLNNFRPHLNDRVLGTATYDPKTDRATSSWTYGNATRGYNFVLSPGDYDVQYDLPSSPAMKGQGESIAVLDFSNINLSLVQQFRTLFGLPSGNLPQVVIDGNDPGIDGVNNPDGSFPGSAVESYLDVEWAGAIAPQAKIYLVIAADTALESGGLLAAEHAVDSDLAPIISSSINVGGCEANAGVLNSFMSSLWEQAAAEGITVVVAAGDSGSAGCDNENAEQYAVNGLGVNSWASTPFDVAVGGTDFYYSDYQNLSAGDLAPYWSPAATQNPATSLLKYIPEQPWNDSQYGDNAVNAYTLTGATNLLSGSGGASSAGVCSGNYSASTGACLGTQSGYPKPSWQTGFGPGSVRDLPDVSLFAADGSNYSYFPICAEDGDCQTPSGSNLWQITGVGGTSAAAPAFAGIMALVDQQYGAQGQADFVLYPLKTQSPDAFHDMTTGTNSVPCAAGSSDCISVTDPAVVGGTTEGQMGTNTTADYNAAAGYNLATGLGSVDVARLIADWGNVKFQSTQTTLSSPSAGGTYSHGSAIAIQGQVTGGSGSPAGTVAIMSDSPAPLQQSLGALPLTGGAFSAITYSLPGGTYDLWGQYSGDGTNGASASAKVQITVNPETSTSYFNVLNGASRLAVNEPSGSSVPYGTQLVLDDQIYGTNYYNNCPGTAAICQHYDPPTGTIAFKDGATTINTAVPNAEGDAEYNAAFGVGSHSITSSYSGDASYQASTGSAITFTVTQDTPGILLSSPSLVSGQPGAITVQVENLANYNFESTYDRYAAVPVSAPTGTVTITGLPGGPLTANLAPAVDPSDDFVEGVATITVPSTTTAGNYNIGVSYSGDTNYVAVTQNSSETVSAASGLLASTTTASITAGSISPNSAVTVTGTVSGPSGDPAPTGIVAFYSSGYLLGEAGFAWSSGNVSSFSVTLNSSSLFQGNNYLTVQYDGDGNYNPSQAELNSSTLNNTLSDFSMVPESATVPLTAGGSNTDIVQLYSVNGFASTVGYTCMAAAGVICSVSPTSSGLTANSTASAKVTVQATSATPNGSYDVSIIGRDSTGEYVHSVGLTAIVSGSTSTGSPSIVLTNSSSISLVTGGTGTSTLTVTPETGFTGPVSFSCSINGAPAGLSCSAPSVDINSTAPQTAALTVSATVSTTPGNYTATVQASDSTGTITSSTTVPLTVAQPPAFSLSNSGSIAVTPGNSAISTLTVTPASGFTGGVTFTCSVAGSPTGLSCSAPPASVSGTSPVSATLTVAASSAAAAGSYSATVVATDQATGSITASVTVSITVATAPPPPSFTVSDSRNIAVVTGNSATTTLTVTPGNGFTGAVDFSCAIVGAPTGLACAAPEVSVSGAGPATSTLTVTAASSAATGVYTANVTATDATTGTITSSVSVSIVVSAPAPNPSFTLSNSGNVSVSAGSSSTSNMTVTPANGFTGPVNFSCTIAGAPSGLSCSAPAATVSGTQGASSTLTVTASALAAPGLYTATVTATDAASGKITSSTVINVQVTAAPSFTLGAGNAISVTVGSSSTSTLTVTPTNGFTGAVNFSCTIAGSPSGVSCGASTVTVSGSGAALSTLTVTASNSAVAGGYTATVVASDVTTGKVNSSAVVPITVAAAPSPSFTLSNSAPVSLVAGATATSTLTVTPTNGFTGAVNFSCSVNGAPAGLSCSAPTAIVSSAAAATANLTVAATASAAPGSYTATVTASDSATGMITSTASVAISVSIAPAFALSNSGMGSINAGDSASSIVTVTPANGFNGSVALSCAISSPANGVSCSLSPSAVDVSSGAVSSTLTVSTTASSAALRLPAKWLLTGTGGATLAFLFLFGIPARRRSWHALLGLLVVILVLAGGGCGTSTGGGQSKNASYTVTVTGASGSMTKTTAFTVTVVSK